MTSATFSSFSFTVSGTPASPATTGSAITVRKVVNDVARVYNGLGQMTAEYQSANGPVDTGTTPAVQYGYDEMDGDSNESQPDEMIYPDGRVLHYVYASGIDDAISRLSYLADDDGSGGIGTHLEEYAYLGLETIVAKIRPEDGVSLEYSGGAMDGTGEAGDKYVGLDRFGRVVEQQWYDAGTDALADDFQYGYDLDGNVLWRDNGVDSSFGEIYTYDSMNRLTTFARGTLNTGHTAISGTASSTTSWTLDASGNQTSVDTNGTTDNRTVNQQNQYTEDGGDSIEYDNNGNVVQGAGFDGLSYDAWGNALTSANTDAPEGSSYAYDALGRKITQQVYGNSVIHLYYDANGNVIEERVGTSTSASVQYVWNPNGVNQLVERDRDTDANGTLDERLYVQQDANGNVTSLINTSGTVVERYIYTPYGQVTVLTGSFGSRSTTSYAWNYLFQGERYDWKVGLYHMGAREYDPQLGRFLQQDPMGYVDGANRYQAMTDNPISKIDPKGTNVIPPDNWNPDGRLHPELKYIPDPNIPNGWTLNPWYKPPEPEECWTWKEWLSQILEALGKARDQGRGEDAPKNVNPGDFDPSDVINLRDGTPPTEPVEN